MMDIEQCFQQLLQQYGYVGLEEDWRRKVYQELRKLLHSLCKNGEKVALKCAGVHTAILLENFSDVLAVDCILDKNPEQVSERIKRYGIPIVPSIQGRNVDKIIISSFEFRKECAEEFRNVKGVEVVDIYESLEQRGYHLTKAYYNYIGVPGDLYRLIIECQAQYRKSEREEEREILLDRLIGLYLDIRDISSTLQYMEEYINAGYKRSSEKAALKTDLLKLIEQIHAACKSRTQQDILWVWQDALPYEYLKDMKLLCNKVRSGICFHESYTPSPVTRSVYARILDQQEEYEIYNDMNCWPKTHKTIEFLKEKGYVCKKISGIGQPSIPLDTFDLHHSMYLVQPYALSELWWNALRELLLCDAPAFLLIHSGLETHPPLISPALEEYTPFNLLSYPELFTDKGVKWHIEQTKKNVAYVDRELDFFIRILNENCIKILMSDHGDVQNGKTRPCGKDMIHTVTCVLGKPVPAKAYDRLFCVTNFLQLLIYLLDQTKENEGAMFSDEIWLNGVDYYDKGWIDEWIGSGFAELGLAYSGILTLQDRYVKLGTGEEFYHIFPDEYTNHIQEPEYQERIAVLRNRVGDRFIDISKHPKFRHSHLLYEALGKKHIYEEKHYEMDK